ncbi:MAG: EAL domain-containing protein [Gammaproteobacteria bacterium]
MTAVRQENRPVALIADDDLTMRLLMRNVLEENNFDVIECVDGEHVVDEFIKRPADIVLLDVEMPGMDGYTACRELRKLENGMYVPIVMVTGLDDVESVNNSYQAGGTDFVSKPINWAVLGHRLRYILRSAGTLMELQASEERTRALVNALPDMILRLDGDGNILGMQTGAFTDVQGDGAERDKKGPPGELVMDMVAKYIMRVLDTGGEQSFEFEQETGDEVLYYETRVVASGDDEVLAIVRDITERKQHEQEIHQIAYYDSLTGLPNRKLFYEHLEREIVRSHRDQVATAVLFLDLDRFKSINDTLGHALGDRLLQVVAERLQECIRKSDLVGRVGKAKPSSSIARIGGDEFTILLGCLNDAGNVSGVARRIIDAIAEPIKIDGHCLYVTASVGIAIYPDDGLCAESLLKYADSAMYLAKDAGKNNFQFYSSDINERVLSRLRLETDLRNALENEELVMHYQPKVDVHTMEVVGVEALVRWLHTDLGFVPPDDFIPVAEEAGMITKLGEYVLRQSCKQMKAWIDSGLTDLEMAVNVSSRQLYGGTFHEMIAVILKETGLEAKHLEIELTESMIMEDPERTVGVLHQLKAMGVSIAVDDFGTGYSSLSYLTKFPLDVLKIDQGFVRDILSDPDDAAVTKSIISMAQGLGMRIVGEGVENSDQLAFLREHGCDIVQGFLFSQGLPADECEEYLRNGRPDLDATADVRKKTA